MARNIIVPSTFEGSFYDENSIVPSEDSFRTDGGSGSFEWWYFDAKFIDGSTLVIVFSTKSLLKQNGQLNPGVSLTITYPNGKKISKFSRFPSNQFFASKDICDVHIGPNWVSGDLYHYQIHIDLDDLIADLTLFGLVPPWRPGTGKVYFEDTQHYFAWLLPIPHGILEGSVTYNGQVQYVKGTCYHDHNWGNIKLNKVMNSWIWGRTHIGTYTLIFVEQIAAKRYGFQRIPIFLLANGDQIIPGDASKLRADINDYTHHSVGREYPRKIDLLWQKGADSIRISIREPQVIEAVDRLNFLPKWQRSLLHFVIRPCYFRFSANLELAIDLGSIKATESGDALYELMYFR